MGVGKASEENTIHHAEHSRARTRAQRQRKDRRDGEYGRAPETADGIAQVLHQDFKVPLPGHFRLETAARWMFPNTLGSVFAGAPAGNSHSRDGAGCWFPSL